MTVTSTDVGSLAAGDTYYVGVKARNSNGVEKGIEIIGSTATDMGGAPKGVQIDNVYVSSAALSWSLVRTTIRSSLTSSSAA